MAVEVSVGERVGVKLGDKVGVDGRDVGVDVAVASDGSTGVVDGRTCEGVLLRMLVFSVRLAGIGVVVFSDIFSARIRGFAVGVDACSDKLVRKFSIADLPGPAKRIQPMIISRSTRIRLMRRAGVRRVNRS